ncbi:unnamed protein product [Vitrella brassicaformis CCMP3155]|uniref:Intraflagellar transport protein 57 homolog n=2 Tax=Vitrella brassicaformis TaxID=1169539 RepID=A0A0G4FY16_VITBC|nr:unnamed protein product [Vitrella brassicaformis CCMP3155]|mmetsp:Transcript_8166/g.20064  ORF Transcript_8166/g.20064 Transcript_8166/m.20064 type:complete len:442 (+) Transcript_8166:65-1390(+)|eukprot:CEM20327.1 unnamed protein product [Vitrella brassicaformis CCMP3155]
MASRKLASRPEGGGEGEDTGSPTATTTTGGERERRSGPAGGGGSAAGGVSLEADVLAVNEEILEMLKLLDYETQFCNKELSPITASYFSFPAPNVALQLTYFHSLVYWLLQQLGKQPSFSAYDDPNTIATNLLVALQELDLGMEVTPQKLKQAYGEFTCNLIHTLLRAVLQARRFQFQPPQFPDEGQDDEAEVDEEAEINAEDMEEDIAAAEDDEDVMYSEVVHTADKKTDEEREEQGLLETQVDPHEWALELERVTPKLKVTMPHDPKEWRTHLEQTQVFKKTVDEHLPTASGQLNKISQEIGGALERVRNKEAFINQQFEHLALDHQHVQQDLRKTQQRYTELNDTVTNLQTELKMLTEQEDNLKQELEDRSSTVTDSSPLVKVKDTLKKLKAEIRQMELKIGVVCQTVLQSKMARIRPQLNNRIPFRENSIELEGEEI